MGISKSFEQAAHDPRRHICVDRASAMYRSCRSHGETVRKLIDCLIAAVAVKAGAEVLHADADFVALGRHTELRLHPSSIG